MKKSQQTRPSKKSITGAKQTNKNRTSPELLLPAGDFEKLKTAFLYGADAVYVGLPVFSLRAKENKFTLAELEKAIKYTRALDKNTPPNTTPPHRQRKKIYITLNIFPHNNKIPALKKQIPKIAKLKPDAFIIADPGIILLCQKLAPQIPIHLSVQANNVNWASAQFWHKQGVERIILARELSLKEIKEIHDENPKLELEAFVHGAICMAYSGRCHLSHYLAGRDANQGTCVQSCRWKYKVHKGEPNLRNAQTSCANINCASTTTTAHLEELERPGEYMPIEEDEHGTYILNSKDLCLIEHLQELQQAGVCSFKIEGRNKTQYYVATTARAYRQAIDLVQSGKKLTPTHIKELTTELAKTSNRGFFTGWLKYNPRHTAIDYQKNSSHQTYEFVGLVVNKHNSPSPQPSSKPVQLEIQVKGRMDAPCKIEIMTPEKDITLTIKEFHLPPGTTQKPSARSKQCTQKPGESIKGESIKTVHPGQKNNVLIEIPATLAKQIPQGAILRNPKN